ncbi:TIGR03619 family F420-dependent LLM class oxidoreductase [Desertibaculum subflavum]|uniref:TIGR03619 family F420-dependent LLM class oxidoreductase n=1 Tax=Desertibaculum subflavum TaxID=2268458 RepID=UPI0013C4E9E4
MLFGFDLPLRGPLATADTMTRIANEAEAMGFGYATISDHVIFPATINARYPYSETGAFPNMGAGDVYDQLTAIAFLSARTKKLRFLTSVMVVPHRPAVQTAKVIATIDVLSGGRITIGCGAGWLREEFEAIGAPPFDQRGEATNEYLAAFKELWTQESPRFAGKHVKFDNILFAPKPTQKPHPPLWVGGESNPALRRAAKLGDGWYPIGTNPQFPVDTLARYKGHVARLHAMLKEEGRDLKTFTLGYRCAVPWGGEAAKASDGERRLFTGDAATIAADIRAMRDLGVSSLDFRMAAPTLDGMLGNMQRFRDEVMAKV